MTRHWLATVFLTGSLLGATAPATGQVGLGGGGPAQPSVVQMPAEVAGAVLSQAPAAPAATPAAVVTQQLSIEAGAGILLQLPRPAATVITADPRVARVQPASPTSLFVIGVAQGRTTLIATNEAGQPIVQYEITVRRAGSLDVTVAPVVAPAPGVPAPPSSRDLRAGNAAVAQAAIRQHVQGAGGVTVAAVEGNLILSGTVATPLQSLNVETIAKSFTGGAGGLINNMIVLSSLQVNVRVRMVEMSRDVSRELGINWSTLLQQSASGIIFGFLSPAAPKTTPFLPIVVPAGNYAAALHAKLGGSHITTAIDALAADNLVTILAEPNLVTQSGESASFLAGGEFPIPVPAKEGSANTIEFKQFGVSLAVVPTILAGNRINMRVRPEVSEIDTANSVTISGTQVPGLTTRRAETTIELGSGQSFAIAGLLLSKVETSASMFPWLGDVPVLGALFKSTKFRRRETELVIIVTPYIVQPVNAMAQLRTPADDYRPATDLNRILYGRQTGGGAAGPQGRAIDAGFILK